MARRAPLPQPVGQRGVHSASALAIRRCSDDASSAAQLSSTCFPSDPTASPTNSRSVPAATWQVRRGWQPVRLGICGEYCCTRQRHTPV